MSRWWRRWVGLWDRRESPLVLALVRIGVAAVLLGDLLQAWRLGLVTLLWAPVEAGGLRDVLGARHVPLVYSLLPPTAETAWALHLATTAAALLVLVGLFTRLSMLALLLLYAQLALVLPAGDRGIDTLLRNVLVILLFSRCGATLSVDALLRTGRAWSEVTVPSWPRYVLILQLVVMYFDAGVEKFAVQWGMLGGWTALWFILQDPVFARQDFSWLAPWAPLTRVATALTILWERSIPLLLLAYHFRDTRTRGGRLRATFNRLDVRTLYVAFGVLFHLGLVLTLRLGIFPWAMLALYPAFFHPDEVRAAALRFARRALRRRVAGPVAPG